MIVTVTPNPSIDRTVTLPAQLTRGAVHRVTSVTNQAGGKGVNVARALTLAGVDTLAVLPAAANDPLITALQAIAVPFQVVPTLEPARIKTLKDNARTVFADTFQQDAVFGKALRCLEHLVTDAARTAS